VDVRVDGSAQQILDLLFACRGRFHVVSLSGTGSVEKNGAF